MSNNYDGNVIEISFGGRRKKKWDGNLSLLTGNIFTDSNFSFQLFGDHTGRKRSRGLLNDFLDLINSATSTGGAFATALMTVFGGSFLLGYIIYRYVYVVKRERKLDFVDLAMRRRFK
ncbi:peroxisomal membrane protein [Acrasis kona]|uniref:Peroxisomal membrane protein n=1 Tax=Acrasis kona TaxID=1008807 RepID=A0AAW2ZIW8_9EUKA